MSADRVSADRVSGGRVWLVRVTCDDLSRASAYVLAGSAADACTVLGDWVRAQRGDPAGIVDVDAMAVAGANTRSAMNAATDPVSPQWLPDPFGQVAAAIAAHLPEPVSVSDGQLAAALRAAVCEVDFTTWSQVWQIGAVTRNVP